jgi:hypothetical protein
MNHKHNEITSAMKHRIKGTREEVAVHLKAQHTPESAEKCYQETPVRIARNLNWVVSEKKNWCYRCVGLLGFKELRIQLLHLSKDALYR